MKRRARSGGRPRRDGEPPAPLPGTASEGLLADGAPAPLPRRLSAPARASAASGLGPLGPGRRDRDGLLSDAGAASRMKRGRQARALHLLAGPALSTPPRSPRKNDLIPRLRAWRNVDDRGILGRRVRPRVSAPILGYRLCLFFYFSSTWSNAYTLEAKKKIKKLQ